MYVCMWIVQLDLGLCCCSILAVQFYSVPLHVSVLLHCVCVCMCVCVCACVCVQYMQFVQFRSKLKSRTAEEIKQLKEHPGVGLQLTIPDTAQHTIPCLTTVHHTSPHYSTPHYSTSHYSTSHYSLCITPDLINSHAKCCVTPPHIVTAHTTCEAHRVVC